MTEQAQADHEFKSELTALIPQMRAFARSLCRDATAADDLAQDALLKAWNNRASFEPGTNMKAWTFMILRNQFYSDKRRSWRSSQLDPEVAERTLEAAQHAAQACDLMLVVGTAGAVYPAAGLAHQARAAGARVVVVNPAPSELDGTAHAVLRAPAAQVLPTLLG